MSSIHMIVKHWKIILVTCRFLGQVDMQNL